MDHQHFSQSDDRIMGRFRDALAGGHQASLRDLDVAEELEQRFPGLGALVRSAWAFHRRAAVWAVTSTPALGVIFTAAGYPPPDGPLHADAAKAHPDARFAYTDGDDWATTMNRALLAAPDPDHVAAGIADAASPSAVLAVQGSRWAAHGGPVSVQVVMAAHRWPGELAAAVLAEYGDLLPSGSTVCLTVGVPRPGETGAALVESMSAVCGPLYVHSAADIEEWITGARMQLHGDGVTYAPQWVARPAMQSAAVRVAEAVALVP